MIVGIFIGLVVFIGGGIGAYIYFSSPKINESFNTIKDEETKFNAFLDSLKKTLEKYHITNGDINMEKIKTLVSNNEFSKVIFYGLDKISCEINNKYDLEYKNKYLKYKTKYINLKKELNY